MSLSATEDIDDFLKPLVIDSEKLFGLTRELSDTFKHLAATSSEQFLPTPINILPKGTEQGRFLAIDVGGSNLRVSFIELLGRSSSDSNPIRSNHHRSWPIEEHVKNDKAHDLFHWIGGCIADVVTECHEELQKSSGDSKPLGNEIPIGITFSFPMIQNSISEAILMPMGKGFAISSNLNLADLVLEGYARHTGEPQNQHLPSLHIAAITNDAVATLASLAYHTSSTTDPKTPTRTALGLIVGTGSNAALPIPLHLLAPSKRDSLTLTTPTPANAASPHAPSVIVNTEFTIRGVLPALERLAVHTRWDRTQNAEVETPGYQPYEYMIAGRYLGELVRLIFADWLAASPQRLPPAVRTRRATPTLFLSDHAASNDPAYWLRHLVAAFPADDSPEAWQWTAEAAAVFMKITHAVQKRSSRLVAAAVAGLLACAGDVVFVGDGRADGRTAATEEIVVAYAGGVIERFPRYLETCQHALDEIVEGVVRKDVVRRIVLREAQEGGVVGAGVLAGTVWNLDS